MTDMKTRAPLKPAPENTFNGHLRAWDTLDRVAHAAAIAAYPYFRWRGSTYDTLTLEPVAVTPSGSFARPASTTKGCPLCGLVAK
jgi:hypothetical protein